VAIALVYGIAAAVWLVVGDRLPGGRWLAVHLFTLGVLTNVVVVFSQHFGLTVTRAPDQRWRWQPAILNIGIVGVLIGIPTGTSWATALGATVATGVVFDSYVRLRRMRRRAVGARFAWVARMYERAHGSFIHGAVLGLLLGVGLLRGSWYGAGRIAHMHVNILGWAGLTLLATLVFFGPTMLWTRIEDGADARAAVALRRGATALTLAVLLLLASGLDGTVGTALRAAAAVALGVYAWAVGMVCLPVLRAARTAKPSAARPPLIALCGWFSVLAWADVVVVATAQVRLLDALGLAALTGVLGQAVVTALSYVAPALRGRTNAERAQLTARLARGAQLRTVTYNIGVVAIAIAAVGGPALDATGARLISAGWLCVIGGIASQLAMGLLPIGGPTPS
jgi:nitrite reductase (NO-forming)